MNPSGCLQNRQNSQEFRNPGFLKKQDVLNPKHDEFKTTTTYPDLETEQLYWLQEQSENRQWAGGKQKARLDRGPKTTRRRA